MAVSAHPVIEQRIQFNRQGCIIRGINLSFWTLILSIRLWHIICSSLCLYHSKFWIVVFNTLTSLSNFLERAFLWSFFNHSMPQGNHLVLQQTLLHKLYTSKEFNRVKSWCRIIRETSHQAAPLAKTKGPSTYWVAPQLWISKEAILMWRPSIIIQEKQYMKSEL